MSAPSAGPWDGYDLSSTKQTRQKRQARAALRSGQSTQMIVGADTASDQTILETSANLYGSYKLKRVYYSAFSPIPDSSRSLPLQAPPLVREHRLYQADWLMRFYGFDIDEITDPLEGGMLPLDIDPKLAWALRHRDRFPLDVNRASREDLLRVPGFGVKTVDRIITARRVTHLRAADLARLHVPRNKALPFIILPDHKPAARQLDGNRLIELFRPPAIQQSFAFWYVIALATETDFEGWRIAARALALTDIFPMMLTLDRSQPR
jgi:predicted DNA-binding helix-hairpin-helix protein